MFDAALRRHIDPPLNAAGHVLAGAGIGANQMTLAGFACGLGAAIAIALGETGVALILVILNRIADGLDGAIARATRKSDLGGYLDIVLDFTFYGAVPFAFAVANPTTNAFPAAALLLAFYLNGATFLGFSVMAEKLGLKSNRQGSKSLYYLGGLAEGAETIAVFIGMCLFPDWFPPIAWSFAALCTVSAIARLFLSVGMLRQ